MDSMEIRVRQNRGRNLAQKQNREMAPDSLEATLARHKHPFAKVNPRQARRFAEATGRLAKTDRVDAAMLAKMGSILDLPAQEPKSENINILRELLTARRALTKDNAAAKTRALTTVHSVLKIQI